ncbi:serine/threonine protein kinase, partial [Streptomyces sp. SID2563]|nr:serine/threonine protein kinase [Streptomyces sp. SID2563]
GAQPLPALGEIDAALAALAGPVVAGDEAAWLLRTELYEWKLDAVRDTADPLPPHRTWLRVGLPPPPVPGEREVRAELEQCYRWLARQRQKPAEYERLIDLSHAVRPQTRF